MRFRQSRVIDRPVVLGSVGETDLLGEDRLAGPRGAGDHDQRSDRHSPAEDTVELRVPRLETFHHEPPASDSTRSTISEFENGLRITTSAPVAPLGFAVSIRTGMEAVSGSALRFVMIPRCVGLGNGLTGPGLVEQSSLNDTSLRHDATRGHRPASRRLTASFGVPAADLGLRYGHRSEPAG